MSKLVFNRDGGKTDEFGHLLALGRWLQGEVIEGLLVAANGTPNMTVNVSAGTGAIPTGSAGTRYPYFVGVDATESVAITTANASNPRNDLIVMYVDKSITPSQSFTNNSNNMLKIVAVAGNPAATPADPSVAMIQAAIGSASNPYIILARVVVGAGVTQITAGNITDMRMLVQPIRIGVGQVGANELAAQAVTAQKIASNAVLPDALANGAGTSWAWKNWTPTLSGSGSMTWGGTPSVAKYIRIGNTVFFVFMCKGTAGGSASNAVKITAPIARKDTTEDIDCGAGHINNDYSYGVKVRWDGTSQNTIIIERDSNVGNFVTGGLYVYITGFYEV